MSSPLFAWLRQIFHRVFKNELVRRVVKNSGYLFSATGFSTGLSFLQNLLVVRLLAPGELGLLATITSFISVINKFASFRMSELVIKYVGRYNESGDRQRAAAVFKAAALAEMLASLVAFGLVWLLAPLGARFFARDDSLAHWFVIYGLIVLANLTAESATGLLQIFDRFRRMAVFNVIQGFVTLGVTAAVYLAGGGMLGVLVAYLAGKTVYALGLTVAAVIEATRRWGPGWQRAPLRLLLPQSRELAHFAVSTNISASLSIVNKDSEPLLLSFFRSTVETGFYRQALALINLVQMPIAPLPQATYPELSREVARGNWGNVRAILRQGSLMAGGFTAAVGLVLVLFGRPVIAWLYTPEYLPSYPAMVILLLGFLVANTFYWNRTALLALGRPDFPTKVNLVLAVLKLFGIFLLVPRYGYLANAGLLAGSYLLGVSICAWKVNALLNEKIARQAAGEPAGPVVSNG